MLILNIYILLKFRVCYNNNDDYYFHFSKKNIIMIIITHFIITTITMYRYIYNYIYMFYFNVNALIQAAPPNKCRVSKISHGSNLGAPSGADMSGVRQSQCLLGTGCYRMEQTFDVYLLVYQ